MTTNIYFCTKWDIIPKENIPSPNLDNFLKPLEILTSFEMFMHYLNINPEEIMKRYGIPEIMINSE